MLAFLQIADSLSNTMTTTLLSSIWSLTILHNSFNVVLHIPRSFTFPDRHDQHAGVSFLTKMPGNCHLAVILQVPSIRFAQ